MKQFDQIANRLTLQNQFANTIWVFRRMVYLFLLVNTFMLLPVWDQIWGPDHYFLNHTAPWSIFSLLYQAPLAPYYRWFIVLQIIFLLFGLFGLKENLTAIVVFFITVNLFHRQIEIINGGHNIIWLMLAYAILMIERPKKYGNEKTTVGYNLFSNLAVWAARVQIAILYGAAACYKLQGEFWKKGEALYYILSTDIYSHPLAKAFLLQSDFLLYAGNYFALGYQLCFPFLIWFRKLKMPLLLLGIFFHLSIALVNGIADFGFAMIMCYFIFLPEEYSYAIRTKAEMIVSRITKKLSYPQ